MAAKEAGTSCDEERTIT